MELLSVKIIEPSFKAPAFKTAVAELSVLSAVNENAPAYDFVFKVTVSSLYEM